MALLTIDTLKSQLSIKDTAQDVLLQRLAEAADAEVKSYIKRGRTRKAFPNWPESGTDTVLYSGGNQQYLDLKFWPVSAIISVYMDGTACYGQAANAFAANTLQVAGTDYALELDDGTQSSNGRLLRLGAFSTGGDYGWYPPDPYAGGVGQLAARRPVGWPWGQGNIKVTFTAGYLAGEVPLDLKEATAQLAVYFYLTRKRAGLLMQQESLGDYSYQLAQIPIGSIPELGTTRQLLSRFREVVV